MTGTNVGLGVVVGVTDGVTGVLVLVALVEVRVGLVEVLVGVLVFEGVWVLVGLGLRVREVAVKVAVADRVADVATSVFEAVAIGVSEAVKEAVRDGRGVRVGGVAVRRVAVGVILGRLLGSCNSSRLPI